MSMSLNLTSLEAAMARLKMALGEYETDNVRLNPNLRELVRGAAIQSFEYTYELSVQALVRYMKSQSIVSKASAPKTFNGLIRGALREGLLRSDLQAWQGYRANRNATSHAYDETRAQRVFESIPEFLEEAEYMVARLCEAERC